MDTEILHRAFLAALSLADGNHSRFAREIGTSQQNVSYWVKNGRPLPGEYVIPAERAGFGSRHVLRPDLYPMDEVVLPSPALCTVCDHRLDDQRAATCGEQHCPHAVQKRAAA